MKNKLAAAQSCGKIVGMKTPLALYCGNQIKDNLGGSGMLTSRRKIIKCHEASSSAKIYVLSHAISNEDYTRRKLQYPIGSTEHPDLEMEMESYSILQKNGQLGKVDQQSIRKRPHEDYIKAAEYPNLVEINRQKIESNPQKTIKSISPKDDMEHGRNPNNHCRLRKHLQRLSIEASPVC